jgi:lipopolysaccharide transport system ATP-binding protein
MSTVIQVENISKLYRLGNVGSGTLKDDLGRWWQRVRGKEDPLMLAGAVNDRTRKAESDYVWALKDINFEVQQGDVLGIIGRNGAGKSTLLKILSKTTAPTTGSVKVKGRIASLLEVGTGFHPELTGRENIYLNGAILGMRKHEITRKLDEIIDFAGVERYIDTPVKRYSSGMYVRLAFSVAAYLESEILVVDEVLAVGDAEFQKKCLGKMNNIAKGEGRTVLFVSHSMAAITNLCSRCLYLNNGRVQAIGGMTLILNEYVSKGRINRAEINESDIVYSNRCDQAYFNSIKIKMDNDITDSVSISKEVIIEAEFTITDDNTKVSPSFHLLDNFGTCIFASFNGPSATINYDKYFGATLSKGRYVTRMSIPGNFLNEANYKISAFLVPPDTSNMSIAPEVLEFKVIDTGEMRKEYTGDWIGQIRPKLHWSTEFLG